MMLLQSKTDTAAARGHSIWHNRHYISSPNVSSIVISCVCLQQSQEYGQLTSGSSGGGSDSSSSSGRRRSKGRNRSVRVPLLMFATILTSLTTTTQPSPGSGKRRWRADYDHCTQHNSAHKYIRAPLPLAYCNNTTRERVIFFQQFNLEGKKYT